MLIVTIRTPAAACEIPGSSAQGLVNLEWSESENATVD